MFSLFIFFNVILAQEIKMLRVGQRIEGTQLKSLNQNGDYYELILDELKNDSDLVVMVKGINPGGDPNIFISRKNKYASDQQEGEIASCQSKGNDLCVIDKAVLVSQVSYYISIICPGNCIYELRVEYDEEYTLSRQDFAQFKLSVTQQSEIIRINVGIYNKSETSLEIEIKALNIYEFETEFQVYLNEGSEIPSSDSHKYIAKDSWGGSKLIELSLQELMPQSQLTMVITGQPGSIFQVKTHTYGILRELMFQEIYEGQVEANDYKVFKVKIQDNSYINLDDIDKKIKWFVRLTPFIGHATLYVNPDYKPVLLEQYLYHFESKNRQVLMIDKSRFKYQGGNERYLYIAVFGNEMCTYELETGIQDLEYQFININVPYEGIIENNELVNYWFVLTGNKTRTVTVELTNYEDESFMVIKKCLEEECKIIEDDLRNVEQEYSNNPYNLFIYSNSTENNNQQMLVFSYVPELCQQFGDFYSCKYVIAIHQNFKHIQIQNRCLYSLLISTQFSHIRLRENAPHKSIVEKNSYNYFKFSIDDQQVNKIIIILTPIQGNFKIYSSNINRRPNKQNFDQQGVNNIIIYDNKQQKIEEGDYYVSVYGESAGLYLITVSIFRLNNYQREDFAWNYIQLYEGSPQDFTLSKEEVGLYKIDLTNYLDLEQSKLLQETVRIEILHESGELQLYGFDHPTSNLSQARWNNSDEIEVQFIDDDYPEVIYLRVETQSYVQFRIIYRVGWKSNLLVLNENFYTWIEKDDYQYFHFTFFKNEDIQLSKRAHSNKDEELVVTAFAENTQYQLKSGTMIISPSSMPLDKCKTSASEIYYCQIQIQVTSSVSTFYSILVSKDNSQIQLTVDEPIIKLFPASYHHYYLFYQGNEDLILNVVNFGYPQPLQILVSKFDINQYPNKGFYDYPLNQQSQNLVAISKTLVGLANSQVTLSHQSLKQCYSNCVLAITVKLVEDLEYYPTQQQTYSIQYSSGAITLQESITYYETNKKDVIKYYKAYVYDNDTNLMIVLTPMTSCDVNIFVSKETYPDVNQYDWASFDYLGDQLVIESGNPKHPKMAGVYFIGVVADSTCSYSIVYRTGKFHYYQMQQGIPHNLVLQEGEIAYFKYQQYVVEEFKIIFKSLSGVARYFVQAIVDISEESDIFTRQIETFSYNYDGRGYNKELVLSPTDRFKYIIAVKSEKNSDIIIAIQARSSKVYLSKDLIMINSLNQYESQNYSYYSSYDSLLKVEALDGRLKVEYRNDPSKEYVVKTVSKETSEQGFIKEIMQATSDLSNQFDIIITALDKIVTFRIQCSDIKGSTIIILGEVYSVQLHAQQSQNFIYNSVQNGDDNTFSIFINMLFSQQQSQEYNKYKKQLPQVYVKYKNQDKIIHQQLPIKEIQVSQYYYLEFNEKAGEYVIEIYHNNDQLSIDFNLILNNNYLNVLIPSLKTLSTIKWYPQYWEYYCPSEGQLLLQIQQCGSPINLFVSNDIQLLKEGQYQKQFQVNDRLDEIIQIKKPGYFYLETMPVNIRQGRIIPFTITAQLVKQDSYIPLNDIKPGNDGNLTWYIDRKDDTYYLTVQGVSLNFQENPNFKIIKVTYILAYQYIQQDTELPFDYCFERSNMEIHDENQLQNLNFSLTQVLDEDKLAISQTVQLNVYTESLIQLKNQELIHLEKFYNQINIHNEYIELLKWKRYIKYSFVFVLIAALLFWLIIYCRKKRNDQKMKFEATEYPNIEMHYRGLSD